MEVERHSHYASLQEGIPGKQLDNKLKDHKIIGRGEISHNVSLLAIATHWLLKIKYKLWYYIVSH